MVAVSRDSTEIEDKEPMSTNRADISNDVVNQHVEVDAVETPIGVIQ